MRRMTRVEWAAVAGCVVVPIALMAQAQAKDHPLVSLP